MASFECYQLTDSLGNKLRFNTTGDGPSATNTRTCFNSPLPYVAAEMLTDQVSTTRDVTIQGVVKCGSTPGFLYASIRDAIAAAESMTPSLNNSGATLDDGDWDQSTLTFASNAAYTIHWGNPATDPLGLGLMVTMVRWNYPPGESYTTGEIKVSITLKRGTVI